MNTDSGRKTNKDLELTGGEGFEPSSQAKLKMGFKSIRPVSSIFATHGVKQEYHPS